MVEAIETLQEILGDSRCAADSELVAQAHDLLGFAFLTLGEHESGTALGSNRQTQHRILTSSRYTQGLGPVISRVMPR
jgi:hypothetical protein